MCYNRTHSMYDIVLKKAARKGLRKMPVIARTRMLDALTRIAQRPEWSGLSVTRLASRPGYRLRIGKYRAVFERNDAEFIILVINIDSRGEIYKRWR